MTILTTKFSPRCETRTVCSASPHDCVCGGPLLLPYSYIFIDRTCIAYRAVDMYWDVLYCHLHVTTYSLLKTMTVPETIKRHEPHRSPGPAP